MDDLVNNLIGMSTAEGDDEYNTLRKTLKRFEYLQENEYISFLIECYNLIVRYNISIISNAEITTKNKNDMEFLKSCIDAFIINYEKCKSIGNLTNINSVQILLYDAYRIFSNINIMLSIEEEDYFTNNVEFDPDTANFEFESDSDDSGIYSVNLDHSEDEMDI